MNIAGRHVEEFSISNAGIKLRSGVYLDLHSRTLILILQRAADLSGKILALRLLHLGNQHYLRIDSSKIYACSPEISDRRLTDTFFREISQPWFHPDDGHRWRKSSTKFG